MTTQPAPPTISTDIASTPAQLRAILERPDLALHDMQEFHKALDHAKQFETDFLRSVGYFAEEVGEVVKAYRHLRDAPTDADTQSARTHLGEELADCLAYIVKLANYGGVDLQDAYIKKMTRNIDRTW